MPYAIEEIREIYCSTFRTSNISSEDMINKLQSLKGKPMLKFYLNISNFYDEKCYRKQKKLKKLKKFSI